MITVRQLIKGSFRLLRTHGQGETPSAIESNEALESLLTMLDTWAADGLLLPSRVIEEFPLVSGKSRYSIGSSGDFDTSRPAEILGVKVKTPDANASEYPVKIATTEEWAAIISKNVSSDIPYILWSESTAPLNYLNLYPVPSVSTNSLVLYSKKPFSEWTLNTQIQMPFGFEKLLKYGLAIELSPEYGKPVTREIQKGYDDTLELIQRNNFESFKMDADPLRTSRRFDIKAGE